MGPKWPLVLPIQPILRVPAGVLGVPGLSGLNFLRFFIDLVSKTSKNLPQIQLKIKFFNVVFKDWYKIADFEKHRKNPGFSQVFPCFISSNHIRRILNFCNNYEKTSTKQGVTNTTLQESPKTSQFLFWELPGSFWEGLGAPWSHLGRSWAPLGRSWALLGASWVPLGRPLGGLGRLLGASWASWAPLGRILDDLGSIFEGFREGLKGGWGQDLEITVLFIFETILSLNPKCKTQNSKFLRLCLPIAMTQPGHQLLFIFERLSA